MISEQNGNLDRSGNWESTQIRESIGMKEDTPPKWTDQNGRWTEVNPNKIREKIRTENQSEWRVNQKY